MSNRRKQEVNELISVRKINIDRGDDKCVKELTDYVFDHLYNNFDELPVDFIIESVTKLGGAPNVVYDLNGLFAVTDDCGVPAVYGDVKIEDDTIIVYIESKEQWHHTIREALKYYLEQAIKEN